FASHAHQEQQARTDLAHDGPVHLYGGTADPLCHDAHQAGPPPPVAAGSTAAGGASARGEAPSVSSRVPSQRPSGSTRSSRMRTKRFVSRSSVVTKTSM